ncbi:glycosyltransferase family 4 protein [Oscillatoria sp. HE19RPO]|uniref:glycosyltransferase family 4 protein n=1 Tax=Oscillatoria sp. HE19RPO TaxID=2954806 RepID=UPI0020C4EEC9|nr:glycosyltransferase family 4 protein [Oscillatoria sp. HE19RPO]
MRAMLLCRADLEFGADRAAYRLHQGLNSIGVASEMLVQNKLSGDPSVITLQGNLGRKFANFRESLDALPLKLYRQRPSTMFWPGWLPDNVAPKVAKYDPDVINLHWICRGYLQIETLAKFNKPLVWTFHDMWGFTGGCNYSEGCDRYEQSCGNCPQLSSDRTQDLSRWTWERKAQAWKNLNLAVATPSQWLAKITQSSALFKNVLPEVRVEVIPNGINTQIYRPLDKKMAREILRLPQDKQLVLFGAISATSDRRKGFHLLQSALQNLSQSKWQDTIELVVFGSTQPKDATDLGFPSHYLGKFSDDISLALIYSAADVFVAPSVEDNLPNTVVEAIACGTPCVAFSIGGMPDLIEHQQNGYLASAFAIEDLSKGIAWVLENPERYQKLSNYARDKAIREFTQELQARRYSSLFEELLSESGKP